MVVAACNCALFFGADEIEFGIVAVDTGDFKMDRVDVDDCVDVNFTGEGVIAVAVACFFCGGPSTLPDSEHRFRDAGWLKTPDNGEFDARELVGDFNGVLSELRLAGVGVVRDDGETGFRMRVLFCVRSL